VETRSHCKLQLHRCLAYETRTSPKIAESVCISSGKAAVMPILVTNSLGSALVLVLHISTLPFQFCNIICS
jgi:hypothetical protein